MDGIYWPGVPHRAVPITILFAGVLSVIVLMSRLYFTLK